MALPTLTFTVNPFPTGRDKTQMNLILKGTIGIASGGDYQTLGLPIALVGPEILTSKQPNWGEVYSPSTGYVYRFDPVNQTLRIYTGASAVSEPMAELANGASVAADTVYFRFEVEQS